MSKKLFYALNVLDKGWEVGVLVILPFLQKDIRLTLVDVGFLSMTIAVLGIVTSFLAGRVSALIGSKNTILLSIGCFAVAWVGFYFALSPLHLYVIYIISGIGLGLFDPISSAIILSGAIKKNRSADIANFAAAGDVGRILMTTLSALLMGFVGWRLTSLLFALLATLSFVLFFIIYKSANHGRAKPARSKHISMLHLLKSKQYIYSLLVGAFDSFSGSSLFIFLPFLLLPKGFELRTTSLFTGFFFVGYFMGRILLSRFADRFGKVSALIVGEVSMAILILVLIFAHSPWTIVLMLFLLGVFTRGTSPVIKAMVADSIRTIELEQGLSMYSSTLKVCKSLSRPTLAFVGNVFGVASIFVLSGVIAVCTIVPSIQYSKSEKT